MTPTAPIIGAPVLRWPDARPARPPSVLSWGGAMLLHVGVGVITLAAVRLAVVPAPSGDHAITLVFAPAPQAEPPAVPNPPDPAPVQSPGPPALPVPDPPAPVPALEPPPVPTAVPPPPPVAVIPAVPAPPAPSQPPPKSRPTPTKRTAAGPARPPAPEPSPAPSADPAPARPAGPAPIAADWQHALSAWLATYKTYPDEARRTGAQGSVVLRFAVDRSGHVLDVQRLDTDASTVLGAAAEAMLRGATLPPFPDTMPQDRVTITVRVHYALTD